MWCNSNEIVLYVILWRNTLKLRCVLPLSFSVFIFFAQASDDLNSFLQQASNYIDSDLDKAELLIEKALELSPENPQVNFLCGRIMGRQAEDAIFTALSYAQKSLSCLQKAVELKPREVIFRMGLMKFYIGVPSIAGGDNDLALEQIEAIYLLDPIQGAKAETTYLRATKQDDVLKAKLKNWVSQYPEVNEFHFRLGLIYQEEQLFSEAFKAFKHGAESKGEQVYHLNSLYQIGRNAVFSHLFIQEGIDSLFAFIEKSDDNANIPSKEWAALRLAQLYSLLKNTEKVSEYKELASKSSDRSLHKALRRIQK